MITPRKPARDSVVGSIGGFAVDQDAEGHGVLS
jgi:hypothetical protein